MKHAILLAAALLAACGSAPGSRQEQEMNALGSALTKLSASVDATVRHGGLPARLPPPEVLVRATAHDDTLLAPFAGRHVLVRRDGADTAVLVCDAPGGRALLEDAGCTERMDAHRWRTPAACGFTLDLRKACGR